MTPFKKACGVKGSDVMKCIIITMPDKEQFRVPLEYIAKNRAEYYAKQDEKAGHGTFDENFAAEVKYVLNDSYEGIDWLKNNMDWEDIEDVATRIDNVADKNYHEAFFESECEIKDI